jgi:hypothetical protein
LYIERRGEDSVLSEPTITDWIQAIGAVVATILAFATLFKLLRRDRNREQQVDSLVSIAKAQQSAIAEMQKQQVESHKQTSLLAEANELERRRRRNEIHPRLALHDSSKNRERVELVLHNIGRGEAVSLVIENIRVRYLVAPKGSIVRDNIRPGQPVKLKFQRDSAGSQFSVKCRAELWDIDGNVYHQQMYFTDTETTPGLPVYRGNAADFYEGTDAGPV